MKPTVQEDVEDDLAAEEENKLINEVRRRVANTNHPQPEQLVRSSGVQDLVSLEITIVS